MSDFNAFLSRLSFIMADSHDGTIVDGSRWQIGSHYRNNAVVEPNTTEREPTVS